MKILGTLTLIFLLSTAPGASFLFAQSSSGSITGTVENASGAPVPNATLELHSAATGARMTTTTDSSGTFRFENVPVGNYRISVNPGTGMLAPGREFTVELNRQVSVNVTTGMPATTGAADRTATAATATDAVTSAETVPTSMETSAVSTYYTTHPIQYLPQPNFMSKQGTLFGAYNLSLLSEAVTTGGLGDVRGPSVGGQRPISNNFHVDGIDNNNKVITGPLVYVPNEATTDFAMKQAQPSPLFGHSVGGNMNSAIRTGTNQVHGALYWYLQNRLLNAQEPMFREMGMTERPRHDQNRMGASLGIPIVPSNLFFFGNFEYIPLGFTSQSPGVFAPTAAGFSTLAGIPGVSATNLGILQSGLGTGMVGEQTRTTTVAGRTVPLGLVTTGGRGFQNQWIGTGAMDWNIHPSSALRARYVHNEFETNAASGGLPAFMTPMNSRSLLANVAYQQNFTAAVTNELRLGYNRFGNIATPGALVFPGMAAFPNIRVQQDVNMALGPQLALPERAAFNTYHLADALNWRIGGHQLRIGADWRRYISSLSGFGQDRGEFAFSTLERFLLDLPPDVMAQQAFGGGHVTTNQHLVFGYIQDTWNWRRNVTLDFGVRYQYATVPEQFRRQALNAFAGVPGVLEFDEPVSRTRNFAPQFGIAWSPGDNNLTVVRAGFSMAYDVLQGQPWLRPLAPGLGYMAFGTLGGNTPGFFQRGGLQGNFVNQDDLTPATARERITSFFVSDPNTPYAMHWNAGIQQAFWRSFTAEVKYIGSRGVHLPWLSYMNVTPGVTAERSLPVFFQQPTAAELNALQLRLQDVMQPVGNEFTQAGFTSPIMTMRTEGNSWYNGLAITLNQRFAAGFHLQGNYTWSHLINDSTGTPLDLTMVGRARSTSIYDRRHRATVTSVFDVAPLFRGGPGWLGNIFANFSLSGTYTYESPQYVMPLSGIDTTFSGTGMISPAIVNAGATGTAGTGVTPLRNAQGAVVAYLANDPNARFIAGAPGTFFPGGHNTMRLGTTNNFDVAGVKRFSFRDRAAFELRGEAYNLFNHSQFTGGPIRSIDFRQVGMMNSFLTPGTPEFSNLRTMFSGNPRTIQVALRLTF